MKTTNKRKQTNYNKVVNIDRETNEITVLDYIFTHSKDFKGATGSKFEAISKTEYEDRMSKDNVIDLIISCGLVETKLKHLEYKMAEVIYNEMEENDEIEQFMFDLSYKNLWDELREYGYSEEEYPVFNCVGGGRCFDKDYRGNINPELSVKIRKIES